MCVNSYVLSFFGHREEELEDPRKRVTGTDPDNGLLDDDGADDHLNRASCSVAHIGGGPGGPFLDHFATCELQIHCLCPFSNPQEPAIPLQQLFRQQESVATVPA